MKRKILIIAAVIIVLLGIGGYFAYRIMTGPMYIPGDLTSKADYSYLLDEINKSDKENYFELNEGISLYFDKQGTGTTPALIIHGGPGIPYETHWNGLDSLRDEYTFYYYHQRGTGKSTRPFDKFDPANFYENAVALNNTLGIPAQLADIEQIRKKLGQEKITLIGHSFGGFLAAMYAIEFPEKVKSLILVTPAEVIKMPSEGDGLYGAVAKKLLEDMQAAYQEYMSRIFDYGKLFEKSEQDLIDQTVEFIQYFNMATGSSTQVNTNLVGGWMPQALYFGMGARHDYSEHLKSIKAPTLIIYGTDDIIQESSVQRYLDNIPGATLKTMSGTHFMFYDNPDEFGKEVGDFLNKYK